MKPTKCRVMCPDCGKQKMLFDTEKQAEGFIKFNGSDITDDPSKLRVYYCPSCCGYHISSKEHKNSYDHRTNNLLNAYHNNTAKNKSIFQLEKYLQYINNIVKEQENNCYVFKKPIFKIEIKYIKFENRKIFLYNKHNIKIFSIDNLQKDQIITLWNCIIQQEKNKGNDMSLYEKVINAIQKGLQNSLNEEIKYNENDLIPEMPDSNDLYYPFTINHKYDDKADALSMARISKKQVQKDNKIEIYYQFGKNGQGITEEILEIGKDLSRLSKRWYLYLDYPHFDRMDDVYDFKVYGIKRKENEILEGAWGYEYNRSDQFLDYTNKVGKLMFNEIINNGNKYLKEKDYWYCYITLGLITDLLQIENFSEMFMYVIDKNQRDGKSFKTGTKMYNLAEKIIEFLDSDKNNDAGWDNFEKYKKTLTNLIKLYKKRIKKFEVIYEK